MVGEFVHSLIERGGSAVMLSLLLVIVPGFASAQTSVNTNVQLTATVLVGLSISTSGGSDGAGNLDFGLVTTGNTGTIDATTSPAASLYTVSGSAGGTITVSYTSPTTTLSDSLGDQLLFTPQVVGAQSLSSQSSATVIASGGQVVINPSNNYYIWVGGTINVPTNQVGGSYAGTFNFTIAY